MRPYALIADGERGALVAPHCDFAWMCAPRWDSGAVFAGLIGGQGVCGVTPAGRLAPGGYYEEGSLIWRCRWATDEGVVECREALAFPGDPRPRAASAATAPGNYTATSTECGATDSRTCGSAAPVPPTRE
ncbi:trehalase-like domain-containing protein [Streptomyces sp. NPDC059096]|uniref:trehalase-like domain-containing protein n=1 Tax=Streptomyces sp. NPDC059096 TaxID=3346727 RepID=UPI0036B51E3D